MKFSPDALFVLAIAAIIAAVAPRASAQGTRTQQGSKQPSGGNPDLTARHKLDLTLSPSGAYDNDLAAEGAAPGGFADPRATGYSTVLVGGADYSWQGRRAQVRATGTSALHYNRPLDDILVSYRSLSHSAGVGVSARLPKRITVLLNQTATYSPSTLYNLFPQAPGTDDPGDAPPIAPDYAMRGYESYSYATAMTLTHDVTRRSRLSASANYQNTETESASAGRRALSLYGIRGNFSHRLARNTAVTAEYLFRSSEAGRSDDARIVETLADHGANIGVDYTRPLSAKRSLTIGGHIGSSLTLFPELSLGNGIGDRNARQLSAHLAIAYQFAPRWNTGFSYRRGFDYVAGLSAPTSADSVTASISGGLPFRMDVLASAGYSNGESALTLQKAMFTTYTGSVRLGYPLTRTFTAHVEYLYYFYDSLGTAPIAPGITARTERNGVRAGLTLRLPALRR